MQLLLFPDSLPDDEPAPRVRKEPALPKVTVTSSPQEIKAAFEAVAKAQAAGSRSTTQPPQPPAAPAATATAAATGAEEGSSSSSGSSPKAMATSSSDSS